jgi:hypothetical protein
LPGQTTAKCATSGLSVCLQENDGKDSLVVKKVSLDTDLAVSVSKDLTKNMWVHLE